MAGSVGNPWWTFQPEVSFSYLRNGWNLTATFFDEINTSNWITGYTSGEIFHAEFTATKTIGKWTVGPVAYYAGQITDDKSSSSDGGAINVNRYNIWAAGGLVGYDFGRECECLGASGNLRERVRRNSRSWSRFQRRSPEDLRSSHSSTTACGRPTKPRHPGVRLSTSDPCSKWDGELAPSQQPAKPGSLAK